MMGAEVVTIAAAESPEPARAVARMTSTIITRILIFYVGSIFVIVSTVPWTEVVSGQSPFTLALDGIHFPYASEFMAAVILTAVLSCLNSSFYVASRVLFVLGSHGDAPRWLVRTNRRQVPARAVLLASAVGFAGVVAAILSPSVVFAFLVNASGAIIAVIYLAIAVSQVRTRRARERAGGPPPTLPMWLFPWLSYVAIGGMMLVLVAMAPDAVAPGGVLDEHCLHRPGAAGVCGFAARALPSHTCWPGLAIPNLDLAYSFDICSAISRTIFSTAAAEPTSPNRTFTSRLRRLLADRDRVTTIFRITAEAPRPGKPIT